MKLLNKHKLLQRRLGAPLKFSVSEAHSEGTTTMVAVKEQKK